MTDLIVPRLIVPDRCRGDLYRPSRHRITYCPGMWAVNAITHAQTPKSNPATAHLEYSATANPAITYTSTPTLNNLLVCMIYHTSVAPSFTTPSGWSLAVTSNGTKAIGGVAIYYKISAGTEGTVTVTVNGSATGAMTLYEVAGAATTSPLDKTGSGELASAGTSLTVTTSGSVVMANEIAFSVFGNGNALSSWAMTGWTRDYDAQEGTFANQILTTASGTISAPFVWGNSGFCTGAIATFKGKAAGSLAFEPRRYVQLRRH